MKIFNYYITKNKKKIKSTENLDVTELTESSFSVNLHCDG